MIWLILIVFFSYFIGAIPTGYWFARILFDLDVTSGGSGNIGATNVARLTGKWWHFILILALDAGKAAVTLFILKLMPICFPIHFLFISAVFLLVGNGLSPFLQLRGGKGVSTLIGILGVLFPWQILIFFIGSMAAFVALFRRVGVASVFSAVLLPAFYALFCVFDMSSFGFLIFSALWIVVRHRENLGF